MGSAAGSRNAATGVNLRGRTRRDDLGAELLTHHLGPVHAIARRVPVASRLVRPQASASPRPGPVTFYQTRTATTYSRTPMPTNTVPPEIRSRPGRHTSCCLTDGAIKPTTNSRTVNSALVSRDVTAARRSRTEAGAERVGSVRSRFANVARHRPAARRETPAWPVVPGDLDTLPAGPRPRAPSASLVSSWEAVLVPQRT